MAHTIVNSTCKQVGKKARQQWLKVQLNKWSSSVACTDVSVVLSRVRVSEREVPKEMQSGFMQLLRRLGCCLLVLAEALVITPSHQTMDGGCNLFLFIVLVMGFALFPKGVTLRLLPRMTRDTYKNIRNSTGIKTAGVSRYAIFRKAYE
jgi:hypothetical protein